MYIELHMYIFIWWGFVALSSQSCCLFFWCWWLLYRKSVTRWVFLYFFFLRWEQTEPLLFKPIVERSGEGQKKRRGEVRQGSLKQLTQVHSFATPIHPSVYIKSLLLCWESPNRSLPFCPVPPLNCCSFEENISNTQLQYNTARDGEKGVLVHEKQTLPLKLVTKSHSPTRFSQPQPQKDLKPRD